MPERAARPSPRITLKQALSGRDNALNLIRLVLASLVIVGHTFPLGGFGDDPGFAWTKNQSSFGAFAVAGFFVISGYLVVRSGMRSDVVQFLWFRFLRIFPGFWTVLLLTAGVLGPILWLREHSSIAGYVTTSPGGPLRYFSSNATLKIHQYGIHDLLLSAPYGQRVGASVLNGSLWTLVHEWRCYLVIAALCAFGVLARARVVCVVIAAALHVALLLPSLNPALGHRVQSVLTGHDAVLLTFIFMVGALLGLYADSIPISDAAAAVCLVVVVSTLAAGGFVVLGYPSLGYLLLWAGARAPGWLKRIGSRNDYSYGVYVYAFPVQMVLASVGLPRHGAAAFMVASFLLTYPLAVASWWLVEKPSLAYKHRGPGRGLAHWRSVLARV